MASSLSGTRLEENGVDIRPEENGLASQGRMEASKSSAKGTYLSGVLIRENVASGDHMAL